MSDWSIKTLDQVCEKITDGAHNSPKSVDHGKPMASVKDLTRFGVDLSEARLIALDTVCTVRQPLNAVLLSSVAILRPDKRHLDSEFFKYYLSSKQTIAYLENNFISGAAIPRVVLKDFKKAEIKLPPLKVQKEIAKVLDSLDRKIELNRQSNQTLEQIAQAIFKSWFVDFEPTRAKQHVLALQQRGNPSGSVDAATSDEEAAKVAELAAQAVISGSLNLADIQTIADLNILRQKLEDSLAAKLANQTDVQRQQLVETAKHFPNSLMESEFGEIPEGWGAGTIGDLFELHRGYDLPKSKRKDGEYLVYAAGGVHGSHSQYKMLPPGIITGRSGIIGNVYLALEKYWPLNTTLYIREFKSCGPYYAYHFLSHCDFEMLNSGSAVPSLNRNFVHSLTCCVPSTAIQRVFEQAVAVFFEMMKKNNDTSNQLREIRDVLLPKLLSGALSTEQLQVGTIA